MLFISFILQNILQNTCNLLDLHQIHQRDLNLDVREVRLCKCIKRKLLDKLAVCVGIQFVFLTCCMRWIESKYGTEYHSDYPINCLKRILKCLFSFYDVSLGFYLLGLVSCSFYNFVMKNERTHVFTEQIQQNNTMALISYIKSISHQQNALWF